MKDTTGSLAVRLTDKVRNILKERLCLAFSSWKGTTCCRRKRGPPQASSSSTNEECGEIASAVSPEDMLQLFPCCHEMCKHCVQHFIGETVRQQQPGLWRQCPVCREQPCEFLPKGDVKYNRGPVYFTLFSLLGTKSAHFKALGQVPDTTDASNGCERTPLRLQRLWEIREENDEDHPTARTCWLIKRLIDWRSYYARSRLANVSFLDFSCYSLCRTFSCSRLFLPGELVLV
ncbi:unnamed protein product [Amoebophrya sp. A25]|nr:unnamed protein product [Amoebophrya sp. A25]|eukprot:GSA25T00000971001.1